jgi:hypothetical protein
MLNIQLEMTMKPLLLQPNILRLRFTILCWIPTRNYGSLWAQIMQHYCLSPNFIIMQLVESHMVIV